VLLHPLLNAKKTGKTVDLSKVPPASGDTSSATDKKDGKGKGKNNKKGGSANTLATTSSGTGASSSSDSSTTPAAMGFQRKKG